MRVIVAFAALLLVVGGLFVSVLPSQFSVPAASAEPRLSADELARREESLKGLYADCLTQMHEGWCVRLLSPLGWYPRDDAECAGIGVRIDKVIALGGEAKHQDLFKNERCARLGQPHSAVAAPAIDEVRAAGAYAPCEELPVNQLSYCQELYGRHRHTAHLGKDGAKACKNMKSFLRKYLEKYRSVPLLDRMAPRWLWFYWNEGCWRTGQAFFEPELAL